MEDGIIHCLRNPGHFHTGKFRPVHNWTRAHASLAGVRRVTDKLREKVPSAERQSFAIFHCDLGGTPAERLPSLRLWSLVSALCFLILSFFPASPRDSVYSSHLAGKRIGLVSQP